MPRICKGLLGPHASSREVRLSIIFTDMSCSFQFFQVMHTELDFNRLNPKQVHNTLIRYMWRSAVLRRDHWEEIPSLL